MCSHVRVEDKASLRDCLVGANFTVITDGEGQHTLSCLLAIGVCGSAIGMLCSGCEGRNPSAWRRPALLIYYHVITIV